MDSNDYIDGVSHADEVHVCLRMALKADLSWARVLKLEKQLGPAT